MCALEFPDLESNLHQPLKDRGLVVIGVHPGGLEGGDDAARLAQFRDQTGATFPIGWDRSSSYLGYREGDAISPFPLDVVVDADGVVRYVSREYEAEALRAVVESLLEEGA